jgi:phosphoglycerate dehydrogenase-like enzyme
LLASFNFRVLAYDPFISPSTADELGVKSVSLKELFEQSDVVSLHTPHLAETEGMITGEHFSAMKPNATFINTARAQVVRQDELIEVAKKRSDLQFVLDVVYPEPPEPSSPLYDLQNVVLTPHIAGSVGMECRRMGRYMVEELERFVKGEPLRWAVTHEMTKNTSHRPTLHLTLPGRTRRPSVAAPVRPA